MKHWKIARSWIIDVAALWLLAAALVWPLFRVEYFDNWGSIESTFIADARFLLENWPHPNWQPLWYCGTRFDYIYPPVLRYGVAAVSKLGGVTPALAYHIFVASFYALGIAAAGLLVRVGSRCRLSGWLAAALTALTSPAFLLLPKLRHDAPWWHWMPPRLSVLVRFGEGPHISSLALLALALAAAWAGVRTGRRVWLALAAVFCALVALMNFYGAVAMAILFPLLAWSIWVADRNARVWWRAGGVVAGACGLAAFWLTPSYLRVTVENLRLVAEPGNAWSAWLLAALGAAFLEVTRRTVPRRAESAWPLFTAASAFFLTVLVVGGLNGNLRVAGEPQRLIPELDMAWILAAIEGIRHLRRWKRRTAMIAAGVLLLAGFPFLRQAWKPYKTDPHFEQRVEYRTTEWMAAHMPDARAVALGSVRFWYDAWHDLPQLGGGSEQGQIHPYSPAARWQFVTGDAAAPSIHWMQALGVEAAIVNGPRSKEIYHDLSNWRKFDGFLPVVYDDHEGDVIYRVPRRYAVRARVVETARLAGFHWAGEPSLDQVGAYADVVEHGPEAQVTMERRGPDEIRLQARVAAGQAVLVQETWDPCWRAYAAGRPLRVRRDPMGFLLVEAPPGTADIVLRFPLPLENRVGRIASAITALALVAFCLFPRRSIRAAIMVK